MTFCVPKHLVAKLKASALRGEVDIRKLYDMSSKERREYFTKFTDKELGKFLNTEFEKAMVSKKKTALSDFVKSTFSPEAKSSPVYKNIIDKINGLGDEILSPKGERAMLEDFVSDKLGIDVTPRQIRIISEKAKVIDEAQKKVGNDLGNPEKAQETLEFFKAKKEMDDYLQSLSPAHNLKVLTGTIGRGMMLFSIKSPILNIGSNVEVGFSEALTRRFADRALRGTDNKLALDYIKMVNKVYQQTGYDISRMTTLNDSGASGSRVLGETVHSQGEGAIRKTGRIIEDVVFKQLMGAPDVAFSSAHFADSVNLNSLKLAGGDKVKAKQMMNDAMKLEPQTAEGEVLRQQAILDAQKATWTDNSWASRVSEGVRKIFNGVSGDLRIGDYLFPFVKTPANVVATGMDYAGMGIPKALVDTVKAFRRGELGSKEHIQSVSRNLVRSGLGITAAIVLAAQFKDDDYVGAYDPARAQIEALRNSNTNSFRVGDKWISTDWLGPLAVPFSAIMYARKYGSTGGEQTFQYGKGVLSQVKQLPGIADVFDYVQANANQKNQSLSEMTGEAQNFVIDEVSGRLVPSFMPDIAKATDKYNRKSSKGIDAVKAKIPGVRQTLPVKENIFGEKSETEPAWSTIIFGSRVKTDQETETIKQLGIISNNTGKSIAFTDWNKSSTKALDEFKKKVGDEKFEQARVKYGQQLKTLLEKTVKSSEFKSLSDDEKLKKVNSLDLDAQKVVFKQYGFSDSTAKKSSYKKKLPKF